MDISGRKVAVIGAAKSGLAAARVLSEMGAFVLLSDTLSMDRLEKTLQDARLPPGVQIESGGHTDRILEVDFIILSPGVPLDIPILKKAAAKGIPLHSEIEIAGRLSRGRRLVVTGSNGKTTTTTLLAEFCRPAFPEVFLGGNIGYPMIELAPQTSDSSVQVIEVSSFQLETISSFRPDIAVITNFFPNHLDRYPDYQAYCQAKERIFLNMEGQEWLILNADQLAMDSLGKRARCRKAWFGWNLEGRYPGVTVQNDSMVFLSPENKKTVLFDVKVVKLFGRHNLENCMAASLAALLAGVPPISLERVVAAFPGVEHRLEWVRERKGVRFINDSKGTNCAASMTALQACRPPVILIAGGRDKGTELYDWVSALRERAKGVVLLGEARERFRSALEGIVPIRLAKFFPEAVQIAADWAETGDTVLLSPACSSYDMFPNFEVRGKVFKDLIMALPEN